MITIYSTPDCGRCRALEKWFSDNGFGYMEKSLDSVIIAEMRIQGIFTLEAPVLQMGEDLYPASQIFQGQMLKTAELKRILNIE